MAAITDLATAATAGDGDYLVVNQSGTDKKMTRTVLGLTGTGAVATGGYTLTVPATGTAALVVSGSWSPSFTVNGASLGTQTVAGTYMAIGDLVFVEASITLDAKNGNTGSLAIESLPFAAKDTRFQMFNIFWSDTNADFIYMTGYVLASYRQTVRISGLAAAAATPADLNHASMKNTTTLTISGVYRK